MHAPLGLPAGGRLCRQNPSRPEGFLPCDHTCNQWRCIVQWHLQQDSDGPMRCKPAVSRPAPASAAGPEWSLPAPSTEAVGGRRLLRDRHVIVRAAAEQLRRLVGLCATAHAEGEREEFDGRGGHTSAAARNCAQLRRGCRGGHVTQLRRRRRRRRRAAAQLRERPRQSNRRERREGRAPLRSLELLMERPVLAHA